MSVERNSNIKFYTIIEFKSKLGIETSEKTLVVKNPNTEKLFLAIGSQNFKCQQDIDGTKELRMLVEEDNLLNACLVNIKSSMENIMFTI